MTIDRRTACRRLVPALMFLATTPALAQQTPPEQAAATEAITVTGTRLATTNANSDNPIAVVTSEDIARSSATTIEDVLQKLPSIGTNGIYATTNNGGEGISCTDFRNLGISRVLVLVNGRRFVHSGIFGVDCVDLNNIPVSLIDRIEVLKDGASSIYGADAVSGVINIILKKNFEGNEIDLNGDITGHGDGKTGEIDGTSGFSTENGNLVLNAGYLNRGSVPQADRAFAAKPLQDNAFITNANGQRVPDPTFAVPEWRRGVRRAAGAARHRCHRSQRRRPDLARPGRRPVPPVQPAHRQYRFRPAAIPRRHLGKGKPERDGPLRFPAQPGRLSASLLHA